MSASTKTFASLAVAIAGLGASGGVFAQSWDLDKCVSGTSSACTSAGSTVTVSGWYVNASGGTFEQGALNSSSSQGWMGVQSKNANGNWEETGGTYWNHAIDNGTTGTTATNGGASYAEAVLLSFTQAIDISQIAAASVRNGAGTGDFQLWRWNGGSDSAPGAFTTSMTGWTAVTTENVNSSTVSGDFGSGGTTKDVVDGGFFSSYWLVSTKFGSTGDAFKLGLINATSVCGAGTNGNGSGACAPNQTVPEPMSLALLGIAALGAGAARRRVAAKRV